MKIDLVVAEIGSTTTIVNAFHHVHTPNPVFLGQGKALTSVEEGDVSLGLFRALSQLEENLGVAITAIEKRATSSAAGGLRMSVHGLAYEMTVRAAKEGALGAGAVLQMTTAGKLGPRQVREFVKLRPNLVLLAGGVDYGDEEVGYHNARVLSETMKEENLQIPVIYAGNAVLQEEVLELFSKQEIPIFLCANVYPQIDVLQVDEVRSIIQQVFEKHILVAPGMEKVKEWASSLWPTPAAVMESAKTLYTSLGDLAVVDVGGATTDVHSVAEGSPEVQGILLAPEPKAKRTVEGDLGVFKNAEQLRALLPNPEGIVLPTAIPETKEERAVILALAQVGVTTALKRHAGSYVYRFGVRGREQYAKGKDLTGIQVMIGTGGVFGHLDREGRLLQEALSKVETELLPKVGVKTLVDKDYIMASVGTFAKDYPEAAIRLLEQSFTR